jgi:hypothetical protein
MASDSPTCPLDRPPQVFTAVVLIEIAIGFSLRFV